MPQDATPGEMWRAIQDIRDDVHGIWKRLDALPGLIASDLDARGTARVDAYRKEHVREHEAVELREQQLTARIGFVEKAVWGVVTFVLLAVGTAVINMVLGGVNGS